MDDRAKNWNDATLVGRPEPARGQSADRLYVVVFEQSGSEVVQLPPGGELVVGRGEAAQIRLEDSQVSRRHAAIVTGAGQAYIRDLGSRNGTHVNGERVTGDRPLAAGDIVTICSATLAFHSSGTANLSLIELPELERRIEEELARSLSYHRPFSVLALRLGDAPVDEMVLRDILSGHLRLLDVPAWDGGHALAILMPESDADTARQAAARILEALAVSVPRARVGFATCPQDGCEVALLLESARSAAGRADGGKKVVAASETFQMLKLGDRNVLIADPAMSRLYTLVDRLAAVDLPVLICGETGTGKELIASALHARSKSSRRLLPMVTVNCAAIPENLVESELFGHERGAFSGAVATKVGLLEVAHGGTVFLDEIGELALAAQAKLLRVLETKRLTRVGDVREREVDIRIIAATNRDLDAEVKAGRFRQDLFFRLSGAMLWLPPLRSRKRELQLLAQAFLDEAATRAGREQMQISAAAMARLSAYSWPGNIRELKNTMEYLAAAVLEPVLEPSHLGERLGGEGALPAAPSVAAVPPAPVPRQPTPLVSSPPVAQSGGGGPLRSMEDELRELERSRLAAALAAGERRGAEPAPDPGAIGMRPLEEEIRELERNRISAALVATGGNRTRAAKLIGMPLRTFLAKLKQYNLQEPAKPRG
jgi:transcriptional regulator with GAF, ATPase, and Fis domain